jgi:AAA15 family ATPase/GTPase
LNPHGAQIIFTTHDTNILDRASLRRDQIWFTEKDAEGGTHLYPLTDFKPRKNENLERGYLQGRYGAVPFIGSPDFLANLHPDKAGR